MMNLYCVTTNKPEYYIYYVLAVSFESCEMLMDDILDQDEIIINIELLASEEEDIIDCGKESFLIMPRKEDKNGL